jgi:hypothetical protein
MNIKVNKIDISIGKVGATAIPAAGICLIIFEPSARIYSAAALVAFAALVVWNLSRGGSVAFPGLALSGRRAAGRPRSSRSPAPPRPPTRPVSSAPAAASRGGPGLAVVLVPIAAAISLFIASNASHAATGRPRALGPASVARAYYAAVNERNWPKAWQLTGNSGRDYGRAYQRWVDGYSCTVWDQITRITSRGDRLLVLVRARETGGVVQDYEFSYAVKDGVLTQGRTLKHSGHAPQGCGD